MNLEEATQKALLNEASFEQLDGDIIIKELCKNLNIDLKDLLARLDELNLDSWEYLELVDAYEAEGYDIKDILDDYEFGELKVNLNEGKFKEQDIENQENADITEQGDIPNNKKRLPRQKLSLAQGKTYKTPGNRGIYISVLKYEIDTTTKKGDMYIAGYLTKPGKDPKNFLDREDRFECSSAEEFCNVYLNN